MAEQETCKNIHLLKRTNILVYVDEALPDILVVTYEFGLKIFKGVLLDSSKKNLPCGIQSLNPAFKPHTATKTKPEDDTLHSVNQRFAYTDPSSGNKKKNVQISNKYKTNKMTVRLRPRQVLCTKCKGICTENSENVSRKRKNPEISPIRSIKRGLHAPRTRSVSIYSDAELRTKLGVGSLVPRLTRLTPEEEMSAKNSGSISKILNSANLKIALSHISKEASINKENSEIAQSDDNNAIHSLDDIQNTHEINSKSSESVLTACNPTKSDGKRVLRKKRSIGSMEDLWDESVFEENINKNTDMQTNMQPPITSNVLARTIKISYGPQGEGTVLKIPAQIENLAVHEVNSAALDLVQEEESVDDEKAARKALKRAKKEARRKVFFKASPQCYLGNGSPRYTIGGSSPRYTIGSASPRHGLGNNSPRYIYPNSYEINMPKRRKHKVKHKKKHKEEKERKYKEEEVSSTSTQDDVKEPIVTQKLSINLKRLNNTYTSYSSQIETLAEEHASSSDEHNDQVPDFPPSNKRFMLHLNSQTLSTAPAADGGRLLAGDVVWGKVHGFPWWPAKVMTITNCDNNAPQAHVAWYGSSTSSLMQCNQLNLYLENFKSRYNKKKRGPYKEAIKQATLDAKLNDEIKMHTSLGNATPHQHNLITQVVPPPLASPREINVAS